MPTTTNKAWVLPVVGASYNTWGTLLNAVFTEQDLNLGGLASVNVAGNSNVTATSDDAECLVQRLTGALTGNISYLMPARGSLYIIDNQTTGAFSVTVKTVAGGSVGIVVAQDAQATLWSDGTNILEAVSASQIFSGNVTIGGDLNVTGDAAVQDNLTVGGDFGVSGSAFVTGNATVTGLMTAGSYPGTAGFSGRLVLGAVTIQWGNDSSFTGNQTIAFPSAFSGTPWIVMACIKDAPLGPSPGAIGAAITTTYTASQAIITTINTATGGVAAANFFWFAIGPT